MRKLLSCLFWLLFSVAPVHAAFDHEHGAWDALLKRHVSWLAGGHESQTDYAGFKGERAQLKAYLDTLSAVAPAEFDRWSKSRQLAFLINAYNAFTVELILTRYPGLKSIRDFGLVLNNPWKKKFFSLLGQPRHLDDIEHGMIRARGVYDDPRIHMAVNCAAIGCPALRPEAYVAERLDAQLDDQLRRFLTDRSRNRYDAPANALQVSKIFDWYGKDFTQGWRGSRSLEDFFAAQAQLLADAPAQQQLIDERKAKIRFLDYDWTLNDAPGARK